MSVGPRLLLLSNSTMSGSQYMEWSKNIITEFLTNKVKRLLFVPFAGVCIEWDAYEAKVSQALTDFEVTSIHRTDNYLEAIAKSEAIVVGGGNTFHLLYKLQEFGLLEPIRRRVMEGVPYVGWSAGSNVAAPDIATTNDMPIVWPQSQAALKLVDYNINPHFNEWTPEGYQGEGRADRLNECVVLNKRPIVAISEGVAIKVENHRHTIVAPDLKLNPDQRVVKIWLFDPTKKNKVNVIDVAFDEDISRVIREKRK